MEVPTFKGIFFLGLLLIFPAACTSSSNVDHSIPGLVKTLKHTDPNMRYWAAESLGHYGPKAKEAVPDLIGAFQDEEKMVRVGVAYALAEIGPDAREAVPVLRKAQTDPEKEVRDAAAYALRQVQRKR